MPEISRFLGILIKMFFSEHNPPYFHALYGEYVGEFDIKNLTMLQPSARCCFSKRMGGASSWRTHGNVELAEDSQTSAIGITPWKLTR